MFNAALASGKVTNVPEHLGLIYDQLSELGFLTKEYGKAIDADFKNQIVYSLVFSHWKGLNDSLQSTVGEMGCGVLSCLPFARNVLQNELLYSAKILNEV